MTTNKFSGVDYKLPPIGLSKKLATHLGIDTKDFINGLKKIIAAEPKDFSYEEYEKFNKLNETINEIEAVSPSKTPVEMLYKLIRYQQAQESDECKGQGNGEGTPEDYQEEFDDIDQEEYDEVEGDEYDEDYNVKQPGKGGYKGKNISGKFRTQDVSDYMTNEKFNREQITINYLFNSLKSLNFQKKIEYIEDINGPIIRKVPAQTIEECAEEYSMDVRPKLEKLQSLVNLDYEVEKRFRIVQEITSIVLFVDISGSMITVLYKLISIISYFMNKKMQGKIELIIACFGWNLIYVYDPSTTLEEIIVNFPVLNKDDTNVSGAITQFEALKDPIYSNFQTEKAEYIIINDGQDKCNSDFNRRTHCISLAGTNKQIKDKVQKSGGTYIVM